MTTVSQTPIVPFFVYRDTTHELALVRMASGSNGVLAIVCPSCGECIGLDTPNSVRADGAVTVTDQVNCTCGAFNVQISNGAAVDVDIENAQITLNVEARV